MKIAVWDTYFARRDGRTMHFDILVPDTFRVPEEVFAFGNDYLKRKGIEGELLSTAECRFCHIEQGSPEQIAAIRATGYDIIEMEHCDAADV